MPWKTVVSTAAAVSPDALGMNSGPMPDVPVSAIGFAGTAAPELPIVSLPCVDTVLPELAMAVHRISALTSHWIPVIAVVPVVMPTGVASVTNVPLFVLLARRKIVAVVEMVVVVRKPRASTRSNSPGYQPSGWPAAATTATSWLATLACGDIAAVAAVLSTAPAPVVAGLPPLRSPHHCWYAILFS